ncbi:MAG: cytochrome c [Proteobacteria bacterium]|nr:cytochrome c [Pseudomonadota bacterium]
MSNSGSGSVVVPATIGMVMGAFIFAGLVVSSGLPWVPSAEDTLAGYTRTQVRVLAPGQEQALAPAEPASPGEQVYVTVCQVCHQANGKGVPGAFPPVAGSDWVTQDPETPIRIVLKGLQGEIDVGGQKFNAVMPPPPGLDDDQIATVLTFVRSSFGNAAPAVEASQVAAIRSELEARVDPWTARELDALRSKTASPPGE